jgi:hypothetical protein
MLVFVDNVMLYLRPCVHDDRDNLDLHLRNPFIPQAGKSVLTVGQVCCPHLIECFCHPS